MLSNTDGLPQMFDPEQTGGVDWPYDIRADAEEIYNKWCRQVFETDILRGILRLSKASKRDGDGGDKIDPNFKGVVSSKHFGNGLLVNGQWWPLQLCALRDGAHGATQGGISGTQGEGAYSVIVSGGLDSEGKPYPDEDHGEWILYCGTDSKTNEPTSHTKLLLANVSDKKPVRLIRSHNAKARSDWAPQVGFRYDGLYEVASSKVLDLSKQRYQFRLERVGCIHCFPAATRCVLTLYLAFWPRSHPRR